MFSYLTGLLVRFQSRPVRTLAVAALVVLVLAVLLGSLVRWLRRRGQDRPESWAALLTDSIGGVLKVLIGLAVLAGLCLHLSFQSAEFARLRGGRSQRNYNAVTTIWGRPHRQRDLAVRLAYETTHFYDRHGMELDPEKLQAATQPVGYRRQVVEHTVGGNPVTSAEHEFLIDTNYRRKGGAWYPGFETVATFAYTVENFAGRVVTAHFSFPLPAEQGLVDDISVALDGKPLKPKLRVTRSSLQWEMPMEIGARHAVTVRYHSRGLDHLRFEPGGGERMGTYRIRMVCRGIPRERINYPVGCMTPTEKIVETAGKDPAGRPVPATTLAWDLDRAVTRLGMGVIIPDRRQAGYDVARLLAKAPRGLVLLLAMVVVTYLAAGDVPRWLPLAIVAAGYHLHYLLMAHLGDYAPGLVGGMILAAVTLTALVAVFQLASCPRFHALATLGLFAVFCVVYPLLRLSDDPGLLLTILHVVLLAYTIALLIVFRRRRARTQESTT